MYSFAHGYIVDLQWIVIGCEIVYL